MSPKTLSPIVVLIVTILLTMSAASQGKRRGPKPRATPSPSPTATPTPVPSPTAVPTPAPLPSPTLSYIQPVSVSTATLGLEGTHLTIDRPENVTTGDFLVAHLGGVPGAIALSVPDNWFFLRQDFNDTFNPFTGYANYRATTYFKVVT